MSLFRLAPQNHQWSSVVLLLGLFLFLLNPWRWTDPKYGPDTRTDNHCLRKERHDQISGGVALDSIPRHIAGNLKDERICRPQCQQREAHGDATDSLSLVARKSAQAVPETPADIQNDEI